MVQIELGSGLKVNIYMEPIGTIHLNDVLDTTTCTFFTNSRDEQVIKGESLLKVDDDNFIACLDSSMFNAGKLRLRMEIDFPDKDFVDMQVTQGLRKEIKTVDTGITIAKV